MHSDFSFFFHARWVDNLAWGSFQNRWLVMLSEVLPNSLIVALASQLLLFTIIMCEILLFEAYVVGRFAELGRLALPRCF